MSGSGEEALPDVRMVSIPYQMSGCSVSLTGCPGVGGWPSQKSGSGREAFPDVRDALPVVCEWLGGPPGCSRVVERPSRMFRRPSRMSGSGWEALPEVREWSGGPPGGLRVVESPSWMSRSQAWMSGSGWEALLDVRK